MMADWIPRIAGLLADSRDVEGIGSNLGISEVFNLESIMEEEERLGDGV